MRWLSVALIPHSDEQAHKLERAGQTKSKADEWVSVEAFDWVIQDYVQFATLKPENTVSGLLFSPCGAIH